MIATEPNKPKLKPIVYATCCPKCDSERTRVVRSKLIVRYCKCFACNHTWKQTPDSMA